MQQLVLDLAPFTPQTFANFIPGKNNEVVRLLSTLCTTGSHQSVYLWGASGSGKTHLLNAALLARRECGGSAQCFEGALFYDLSRCDLLVADDVHLLDEDAQAAFFRLYNERREAGLTMLSAGNAPPSRLPLRDDLRTRLAWELVYEVHVLDDREKAEALEARANSAHSLPLWMPSIVIRCKRGARLPYRRCASC
jgi:DnaA family protein